MIAGNGHKRYRFFRSQPGGERGYFWQPVGASLSAVFSRDDQWILIPHRYYPNQGKGRSQLGNSVGTLGVGQRKVSTLASSCRDTGRESDVWTSNRLGPRHRHADGGKQFKSTPLRD